MRSWISSWNQVSRDWCKYDEIKKHWKDGDFNDWSLSTLLKSAGFSVSGRGICNHIFNAFLQTVWKTTKRTDGRGNFLRQFVSEMNQLLHCFGLNEQDSLKIRVSYSSFSAEFWDFVIKLTLTWASRGSFYGTEAPWATWIMCVYLAQTKQWVTLIEINVNKYDCNIVPWL